MAGAGQCTSRSSGRRPSRARNSTDRAGAIAIRAGTPRAGYPRMQASEYLRARTAGILTTTHPVRNQTDLRRYFEYSATGVDVIEDGLKEMTFGEYLVEHGVID